MDEHALARSAAISLEEISRVRFVVDTPFNRQSTLIKPSHFPSPFDKVVGNDYMFVTTIGNDILGVSTKVSGEAATVELSIFVPSGNQRLADMAEVEHELKRRLGLSMCVDGYATLWSRDPILSKLPGTMLGARPSSPFSVFQFLVICVLLQNTIVRRTVQMANALAVNLGRAFRFPSGEIVYGICEPERVLEFGEANLRELRLGYRAKVLTRIAKHFADDHGLEQKLLALVHEPEKLRLAALDIYGVGPASAGYLLFEWFKYPNDFQYVSPWERKILSRLLFERDNISSDEIIDFCIARWSPYTMMAVHALFESVFWYRKNGDGPEWLDELIRL